MKLSGRQTGSDVVSQDRKSRRSGISGAVSAAGGAKFWAAERGPAGRVRFWSREHPVGSGSDFPVLSQNKVQMLRKKSEIKETLL